MRDKIKKQKGITLIALIVTIIAGVIALCSTNITFAHNVEIASNPVVTFPSFVYDGKGEFLVWSKDANYKLYYQAVEISRTDVNKIKQIEEDGKKELAEIKTKIDSLYAESENLKTTYKEKVEEYNNLVNNKASEAEIEKAEKACEDAEKKYKDKVGEHNAKMQEYNNKVKEVNTKIYELTPGYVEGKWIETTDKTFTIDVSSYTGEKDFVVWAKLIDKDGTHYNESICTMEGTKKSIDVTGIKLDKTEATITEGSQHTLVATVTPTDATNKTVTWSSSDEKVAKVESGRITAVSEGTATITAKTYDGEYTATCKVTVSKKEDNKTDGKKDDTSDDVIGKKYDPTVTPEKNLPKTGTSLILGGIITALVIISIVMYKKYKFLRWE